MQAQHDGLWYPGSLEAYRKVEGVWAAAQSDYHRSCACCSWKVLVASR